jgi:hypothetical protein
MLRGKTVLYVKNSIVRGLAEVSCHIERIFRAAAVKTTAVDVENDLLTI